MYFTERHRYKGLIRRNVAKLIKQCYILSKSLFNLLIDYLSGILLQLLIGVRAWVLLLSTQHFGQLVLPTGFYFA